MSQFPGSDTQCDTQTRPENFDFGTDLFDIAQLPMPGALSRSSPDGAHVADVASNILNQPFGSFVLAGRRINKENLYELPREYQPKRAAHPRSAADRPGHI